jgi:hypothetical protein
MEGRILESKQQQTGSFFFFKKKTVWNGITDLHLLSLLQGKYELLDYFVPPDKLSEDADRGEYKAQFKSNLASGSCVYGQEVYFKIVDKQ